MKLLTCTNLCIGYDNQAVKKDISFSIDRGDCIFILGHNGSGKSTLMKTLLGINKAVSGTITTGEGFSLKSTGYLPQQTAIQRDFPASVMEIVLSGCFNQKGLMPFYSKKLKTMALENLSKMGIKDLARKSYSKLSGGQQQRVLLARALCSGKDVLLLDEPVSALDPQASQDFYSLISDLHSSGYTVIMISHDIEAASKYADKILYLDDTVFFGTREEYIRRYRNV